MKLYNIGDSYFSYEDIRKIIGAIFYDLHIDLNKDKTDRLEWVMLLYQALGMEDNAEIIENMLKRDDIDLNCIITNDKFYGSDLSDMKHKNIIASVINFTYPNQCGLQEINAGYM